MATKPAQAVAAVELFAVAALFAAWRRVRTTLVAKRGDVAPRLLA